MLNLLIDWLLRIEIHQTKDPNRKLLKILHYRVWIMRMELTRLARQGYLREHEVRRGKILLERITRHLKSYDTCDKVPLCQEDWVLLCRVASDNYISGFISSLAVHSKGYDVLNLDNQYTRFLAKHFPHRSTL